MRFRVHPTTALCLASVLALALLLATASMAFANPTLPPTMSLADLQAKITASGTVDGYFKTVDKGSTIEKIDCTIEGLQGGLIIFDATGPQIDKFGGIAAGMSGSPVYVTDGGVDKIVGAVSYGDYFTIGGTGLATPIESMTNLETNYSPAFQTLSKPVITASGVVNQIIIVPNPQDYSGAALRGAFVAKPLAQYFIGGLKTTSRAYKAIAKNLGARGVKIVPLVKSLSATPVGVDPNFETTMTQGAAIAALETRGDMWFGDLGTVTYAADNDVVAFGHPMNDVGETSVYMLNAWIDGVWPSQIEPYKMGEPTKLRGTITQDRDTGILGQLDLSVPETAITAYAKDDKGHEATSAVYAPRSLIDTGIVSGDIVAGAVSVAGYELFDSANMGGSADVTTTVKVSDGSHMFTIQIPNLVDDSSDVPYVTSWDAGTAISSLQNSLGDGVTTFDVLSVDVQARIHSQRRSASVVGVTFPNGPRIGANAVRVSMLVYGVPGTQTVDSTMTIPAGTPLTGTISAEGVADSINNNYGFSISLGDGTVITMPSSSSQYSRESVADIVADLNNTAPNNAVTVTFQPGMVVDSNSDNPAPPTLPASITTTVTTNWVMDGNSNANVTRISLDPQPSVWYGDTAFISGEIDGPSKPGTVTVYATPYGGGEVSLGSTPLTMQDGALMFEMPVDNMQTNTTFRVHYDGSEGFTPANGYVGVGVQAMMSMSASAKSVKAGRRVTLRTSVFPASAAGGTVVFEYNDKPRHWKKIGSKTLVASGSWAKASISWKVPKKKHAVRARFLGSNYNAATTASTSVTGK